MKLVDTNVWLALSLSKHSFHTAAQVWLTSESTPQSLAFCRATQQSYLRLMTTPALAAQYGHASLTNAEAWGIYEQSLTDPRIALIPEPEGLEAHWKSLACLTTSSPKVWMDAYLAAFAIAGGHQFVTTDRDFQQFSTLDCLILAPS